ncbi:E3 SUMO-protein ligase PIAS4 [Halotydeus destructor]|nr:E3 SUMO-protein ligase PIAS4 [Halotydeus destructor]
MWHPPGNNNNGYVNPNSDWATNPTYNPAPRQPGYNTNYNYSRGPPTYNHPSYPNSMFNVNAPYYQPSSATSSRDSSSSRSTSQERSRQNGVSSSTSRTHHTSQYNGSYRSDSRNSATGSVQASYSSMLASDPDWRLTGAQAKVTACENKLDTIAHDKVKAEEELRQLNLKIKALEDSETEWKRKLQQAKADVKSLEFKIATANANAVSQSTVAHSTVTRTAATCSTASIMNPVNGTVYSRPDIPVAHAAVAASNIGVPPTPAPFRFSQIALVFAPPHGTLIPPQLFTQGQPFSRRFALAPHQVSLMRNGADPKVLLRCCVVERLTVSQPDQISLKLTIKLNSQIIFTGGNNKKNNFFGLLDISKETLLDGSTNILEVSFNQGETVPGEFGISVVLASKATSSVILGKLKQGLPSYLRPLEQTKALIKSKLVQSSDVMCESNSIKISLICPISKRRFDLPCFGSSCEHLSFFNAETFVELNKNKYDWNCPICRKTIGLDDLRIDGYLLKILSDCKPNVESVEFDSNGDWVPVVERPPAETQSSAMVDVNVISPDVITLDSSEDEEPPPVVAAPPAPSIQPSPAFSMALSSISSGSSASTMSKTLTTTIQRRDTESSNDSENIALSRRASRRQKPRGKYAESSSESSEEESDDEDNSSGDTSDSDSSKSSGNSSVSNSRQTRRRVASNPSSKVSPSKRKAAPPAKATTAKKRSR